MTEEWRVIAEWPNYQVSNLGRVSRVYPDGRRVIRKLYTRRSGHQKISFYRNGKWYHPMVHRLVLEAFVGPAPPGMICRHFPDNNASNNRLDNLSWATPKINQNDRKIHGTDVAGEKHPLAKLNDESVSEIRKLSELGLSRIVLSKRFNVSVSTIKAIRSGRLWKHLISRA